MSYERDIRMGLLGLFSIAAIGCSSGEQGAAATVDATTAALADALTLHASFDNGVDAEFATGDGQLYTIPPEAGGDAAAPGLGNPAVRRLDDRGRFGGALEFTEQNKHVIFFRAAENVGFTELGWSGTVSFWLSLTPDQDLAPGFCDPIQITDTSYDDAAVWVDFPRESPRAFRLGVFGDRDAWNPESIPSNDYPFYFDRLVVVEAPPFQRGSWTHIVVTYDGLGSETGGTARLYLNGELQGTTPHIDEAFTWDIEMAQIRIGVNYIGLYDELALFDRPLSDAEVFALYELESGVAGLRN